MCYTTTVYCGTILRPQLAGGACAQWNWNPLHVGDSGGRGNMDKYDICGKCNAKGFSKYGMFMEKGAEARAPRQRLGRYSP